MTSRIVVDGLFKAYGSQPEALIAGLRAGRSREAMQASIDGVVALDDVDLTIEEGEIFILMGLSGSGKSTLIRCINRLVEPTAGTVSIDGEDITRCSAARLRELRRGTCSMVFQSFGLMPHLRVHENVEYGLMIRGEPAAMRDEKARAMLDLVGLSAWRRHYPQTLSGGMRQRVGLARALATDCDILLMDEPFSALDPLIRRELQDELLALQRKLRKTIVFVTHDFQEAVRIGSRIAVLRQGRVVQVGTPSAVVARPADAYVAAFSRELDRTRLICVGDLLPNARAAPGPATDDARPDTPRIGRGEPLDRLYPLMARHSHVAVTDGGLVVGHLAARDVFAGLCADTVGKATIDDAGAPAG